MNSNYIMLMAKFIHSHPELQMQTPRVWKTHYEDECQEENKIYAFTALKQYSSLVRIQRIGRNHLYGSAKIPAKVLANQAVSSTRTESKRNKRNVTNKGKEKKCFSSSMDGCQLELDYSPDLAISEIQKIMISASEQIEEVFRRTRVEENK